MTCSVYLERMAAYDSPGLDAAVARLLEASGFRPRPGERVLVKPNLVAPYNATLSCTHPLVVRSACRYLADCRARAVVGDSPAFGTARIVAGACGLDKALAGLPARIENFGASRRLPLTLGGSIAVARAALEADSILNVPRVKAHDQMLLTLAVKNLFGCVTGFRKALAHQTHGEKGRRFESMILDVCLAMPPTYSLIDGVVAMHVSGPAKGRPYPLGLLGASANPVALDAALHAVLGLPVQASPLGREALERGLVREAVYPWLAPEAFDASGFEPPRRLVGVAFKPARFLKGRLKSLYLSLTGRAPAA